MPAIRIPGVRFTIAEFMGAIAVLAVACAWPVLLVPTIIVGLSPYLGTRRRRVGVSLAVVASCLYAPFSWLLLVESGWNNYRLYWLNLWPILPGFIPGALFFHPFDVIEFSVMGVTTLGLLVGLTWLGSSGRGRLIVAAGIALLVSVPSALMSYAMFLF